MGLAYFAKYVIFLSKVFIIIIIILKAIRFSKCCREILRNNEVYTQNVKHSNT